MAYGRWIERQRAVEVSALDRETADVLLARADEAKQRIAEGIDLHAKSPEARRAFTLANEAMARQARQRLGIENPQWHLFQLAFVLLSLPSVFDDQHADRATVELIFFPTGGGKTEAYLGVIAFTVALRRLRGQSRPDGGRGVAVILRYTLRLLTLDQLERAATLMCALELLRREFPSELGGERFAVGLWVGRSATSNTMAEVKAELGEFRKRSGVSPCPLAECPWCKTRLGPSSLTLDDQAADRRDRRLRERQVPVLPGEPPGRCTGGVRRRGIHRELPSFVVGTVDKFAMLPCFVASRGRHAVRSRRRVQRSRDDRTRRAIPAWRNSPPAGIAPAGADRAGRATPDLRSARYARWTLRDRARAAVGPRGW